MQCHLRQAHPSQPRKVSRCNSRLLFTYLNGARGLKHCLELFPRFFSYLGVVFSFWAILIIVGHLLFWRSPSIFVGFLHYFKSSTSQTTLAQHGPSYLFNQLIGFNSASRDKSQLQIVWIELSCNQFLCESKTMLSVYLIASR